MKETDDLGDLRIAGKDIKIYRKETRREGVKNYSLFKTEIFGFHERWEICWLYVY